MKCEICGEYEAVNECEICGKKICVYCSRYIEKPTQVMQVYSSTIWITVGASTTPYYSSPSTAFTVEMILCKHCCDRLKLSLRIASVSEDEVE